MQTRTADLVHVARAGDQAWIRAGDGGNRIRVEHHQPVRSVNGVASAGENGARPDNQNQDGTIGEMRYVQDMRATNAEAVG